MFLNHTLQAIAPAPCMIVLTALCADLTLNNLPSKPLTLPDCAASST